MGKRITIDSATLMNKGFEVIEACWLFDFPPKDVEVVVHPQSKVHALVEYMDGSVIAQVSRYRYANADSIRADVPGAGGGAGAAPGLDEGRGVDGSNLRIIRSFRFLAGIRGRSRGRLGYRHAQCCR